MTKGSPTALSCGWKHPSRSHLVAVGMHDHQRPSPAGAKLELKPSSRDWGTVRPPVIDARLLFRKLEGLGQLCQAH